MTPTHMTARRGLFAAFAVCAAGGRHRRSPFCAVGAVGNRGVGSVCGQ